MQQKSDGNHSIKKSKRTVFISFLILSALFATAGVIASVRFSQLLDSIDELSLPDEKLLTLNLLLTNISETEANVKAYAITSDKSYLENYGLKIEEVQNNLDQLRLLLNQDSVKLLQIDSLTRLYDEKVYLLNEFAKLRKAPKAFTQRALDIMEGRDEYAAISKEVITTTTETTTIIQPIERRPIVEEKDKGFWSGVKKVFGRKPEIPELVEAQEAKVLTETRVQIDTGAITGYQPDTVLFKVREVLNSVKNEEYFYQNKLSKAELNLLERDKALMTEIRMLINVLEREEKELNALQISNTKQEASQASYTLFQIGAGGLMASLFFVWLIFRDINKQQWYRDQITEAKEKAEVSARAKQTFLSNMSHEIRTPLNAISGFSEQLSKENLPAPQHKQLQAINSASQHLLGIVNDILDLAKIESGQFQLNKVEFSLAKVLEEIHQLFSSQADSKSLKLTTHQEPDQVWMHGDDFRLRQILINLVGNAIKFTHSGEVKIVTKVEPLAEQTLTIKVIDTGIGIEAENLSGIFDKFKQEDGSITRQFGGTGLGLSITKQLVDLQLGTISVESTKGKGTTFTITLPYQVTEAKKEEKKTLNLQIPAGIRILAVDDDAFNLELLKVIFSSTQAKLHYASNGLEALSLFNKHTFDLVITDIQMPLMDGLALTRKIREQGSRNQTCPVLAFTADAMRDQWPIHQEAGITDHLLKPITESQLFSKINEVLQINSQAQTERESTNEKTSIQFSISDLQRFAQGDDKALINMLQMCIQTIESDLILWEKALASHDLIQIGKVCHRLKSSTGQLRANELSLKLLNLEKAVMENTWNDTHQSECIELIKQTQQVVALLQKEMNLIGKEV